MTMETSRRNLLLGVGALGVGAATLAVPGIAAATTGTGPAATRDADNPRFTIAVVPDTQYLFDGDRGDPAPLAASLKYIVDHSAADNTVFAAHLGDVVENAAAGELAAAGAVFREFDRRGMPYSVLAGNHDINSRTDDTRGPSPYLDVFGPARFQKMATFGGATSGGYNTFHTFRAAGREWLVFALDWRVSAGTVEWCKGVLAAHPRAAAILTTHDLAFADDAGAAHLSEHGQRLWDGLIRDHDQIFLTLNGHYWPSGRTVLANAAGHDVHVHVTNYQDRYYGGSAMIRLYHFDLARDTIDVETFSPWLREQKTRNALGRVDVELTDPVNRFNVPIDFGTRFAGFAPVPARPARPAAELLVPGTVAYWRFDAPGDRVEDRSGAGNHLTRVTLDGSAPDSLRFTAEHHPDAPAHGSVFLGGAKRPARGSYLRTADNAPLNTQTFAKGYTVEAFVRLPADARDNHAWMGVLSRMGDGGDAGRTGDDPAEPLATLNLSDGLALQWAVWPLNRQGIATNWGHEMVPDRWFHVAVVNNGRTTTMYVDGAKLLRNPSTPAVGLGTVGKPWLVGATTYDNVVEQGFYGWIGDVRIVDRALPVDRFMTA
ncbi:LamG-like jellyroll fold domain-containing protein [Longispora sp. NPDC051575]|uniref:LamG-like jellyroll fold domain-containing protein n=1 Tax=Longispora sp. NPDC051575 TaxID=3154943 RepID=UPI00343A1713